MGTDVTRCDDPATTDRSRLRRFGPATPRRARSLGQSLVELALCLPLLIVLLFGIVDFGYYMFVLISVNNATRTGCRRAAMNNLSRSQIRGIVVASAVGCPVSSDQIDILTKGSDPDFPGGPPTVRVETQFTHRFFATHVVGIQSLPIKSAFKTVVVTYTGAEDITF
ncbi:MAG: pilus assembly protein [Candidatus Riflebacteria bacterium]|nr:pilus assembly protein [Candidatus Riflebacteria bacterium]